MTNNADIDRKPKYFGPVAVIGLTVFYLLTAPNYHVTAIDSYSFADIIENDSYSAAPLRLFLWVTAMQALFDLVSIFAPDLDAFKILAMTNAVFTALTVVLIARLLDNFFSVSNKAAWLTAGIFAFSYGTWRYATETEVYAAVALLAVLMLHFAFTVANQPSGPTKTSVILLAIFATFATLSYQPLGIVAGVAIPVFLVMKISTRLSALYFATFGALILFGVTLIRFWRTSGMPGDIQDVFDTDGKIPNFPDLSEIGIFLVAAFQNLLSVNWVFAFGPTRHIIDHNYALEFKLELVAAEQAHWSYWVFVASLLSIVILLTYALVKVLRHRLRKQFRAEECCVLIWALTHAAMVLSLHPDGFEAWLPFLVPVVILLGTRLVSPLLALGYSSTVALTLIVFLMHNWFAGVGIFAWAKNDYNQLRGSVLATTAEADDLIVVGTDWAFEKFMRYSTAADTLLVSDVGTETLEKAIASTAKRGGDLFLLDDVVSPPPQKIEGRPEVAELLDGLVERFAHAATRLDLDSIGYVLRISEVK